MTAQICVQISVVSGGVPPFNRLSNIKIKSKIHFFTQCDWIWNLKITNIYSHKQKRLDVL